MLTMNALAKQGLPHSIPAQAAGDHTGTGWEGGFERDGSENYRYTSPDGRLTIMLIEMLPDSEEDEAEWTGHCDGRLPKQIAGNAQREHVLNRLNGSTRLVFDDTTESAGEALEGILSRVPEEWLQATGCNADEIRRNWRASYADTAGAIPAPLWI